MPEPQTEVEAKVGEFEGSDVAVDDRPRDDQGRFTSAEEESQEDDAKESEDDGQGQADPAAALDIDNDDPPTYDFDEDRTTLKFVGGKFLGKYDTVDDALKGHKHALKRIGQLEHDLSSVSGNGGKPSDIPYIVDLMELTDDQWVSLVQQHIGKKELTDEEWLESRENPAAFMAKNAVKVQRFTKQIEKFVAEWDAKTKAKYPDVFDKAKPLGDESWKSYKEGKYGPSEFRVILGLGEMVRRNLLSGKKELTKTKPKGRSPVTTASRPAVEKPKSDPRALQNAELAEMRKAAYGS